MKTLILGMGNPIMGDDGVGIWAARALKDRVNEEEVTVMETGMAGLNLLELLADYDRAIIIDAIKTGEGEVGKIYRLEPETLNNTRHAASTHGIDFSTALELGNRLGLNLPKDIVFFGIEVADANIFSEKCTPKVEKAIPVVADMVVQELNGGSHA